MKNPLCNEVLLVQPLRTEVVDSYSWFIANCILNVFLSLTAVIFNTVTIQALRKTSSLPETLKTFLLSLAVSDLGVGFLVQPLLVVLLFNWFRMSAENSPTCALYTAFTLFGTLNSAASFFGVLALSTDRFLAIYLHLRYKELLTPRLVVFTVVVLWVFCATLSFGRLFIHSSIAGAVLASVGIICLVTSAILYCKVYLAVRRHEKQIQALQIGPKTLNTEMTVNLASGIKAALGTFHVYLVILICYLPLLCIFLATPNSGRTNATLQEKKFAMCSWTLVFLNSSLNPIIYCWKMRHIRRAIIDTLRNFVPQL